MDVKVLRAAVSAAIRVTVSTTLIGCGGNVTTDAGGARTPEPGTNASEATSSTKGEEASSPYPIIGPAPNDAKPSNSIATGGAAGGGSAATGGVEVGGMANAAGANVAGTNEASSAGAPPQACAPAAEACLTTLEQTAAAPTPSAATQACCETVLQALSLPPQLGAECFDSINTRFMQIAVRPKCCTDPSSWQHQACAPWGPPVPPELSLEALLEWSAAA